MLMIFLKSLFVNQRSKDNKHQQDQSHLLQETYKWLLHHVLQLVHQGMAIQVVLQDTLQEIHSLKAMVLQEVHLALLLLNVLQVQVVFMVSLVVSQVSVLLPVVIHNQDTVLLPVVKVMVLLLVVHQAMVLQVVNQDTELLQVEAHKITMLLFNKSPQIDEDSNPKLELHTFQD